MFFRGSSCRARSVNPGVSEHQRDYTVPMLIFAGLGACAIVFAFLLKAKTSE